MKYNYGYNGSGLPMHCTVVPLKAGTNGKVLVRFPQFIPPFDRWTETATDVENERWVPSGSLYSRDLSAPIASFNWND